MISIPAIVRKSLAPYIRKKPFLLGLSGGPDSVALFYALLEEQISFEVAHVDHGWREESGSEAISLQGLCARFQIKYHLKKLDYKPDQKNLEDYCRQQRLRFFKECVHEWQLEALLLGHHRDDRAETVLKRVFEGATLPRLAGIGFSKKMEGIIVLRPLIEISKDQILSWLEIKKIDFFVDATNFDDRFLRTRLRQSIIPMLSTHFGKNIANSLCRLSDYAIEFQEYLNEIFHNLFDDLEEDKNKLIWKIPVSIQKSSFLLKLALREFFSYAKVRVSLEIVESIVEHLHKGSIGKKILLSNGVRLSINCFELVLDFQYPLKRNYLLK